MPASVGIARLAGYQGGGSILSAALRTLAHQLESDEAPGWDVPVHFECDVTAAGHSARSLFDSVERGERQIAYMASGYLAARVPELGVLDLPFSVQDRAAAMAALDGEVGERLRQAVRRQTGMAVLAFWDNGFRHLSNALHPIRGPADCQGLVLRTLDNANYRALFDALGFQAVSLDVKDLVHAVESGAVQAQENPLTNLINFGLWRQHRHVSLTAHLFGVLLLVCPDRWLQSLAATRRAALERAVERATRQQRQAAADEDTMALRQLSEAGVQLLGADQIDQAAFRRAAATLTARLQQDLPPELLRAYLQTGSGH